jgi:MFS family permease
MFWRYWTASTISLTGDAVTATALPLTAIEVLKASNFEVSWLTAATYSAWLLLGLPAGVIVQHLPMRGTQIAMDLIRAAALISLPLAYWASVLTITQLVLVALAVGFATVIFDVGNSTLLPFIVSSDQLTTSNSLMDGAAAVTQTGGVSLGGTLVQFATAPGALVWDVVSYVVSAFLLATLPRPQAAADDGESRIPPLASIRQGLIYVVKHPVIGPCTLYQAICNIVAGGLLALTPLFLVRAIGAPPWLVGVMLATEGVGGLCGASLAPWLASRIGTARAVLLAAAAGAVLAVLMPSAASSWWGFILFGIGNAGFAAGVVIGNILTRTYRQTAVPPEIFPQVMATVRFISWGVLPLTAPGCGCGRERLRQPGRSLGCLRHQLGGPTQPPAQPHQDNPRLR